MAVQAVDLLASRARAKTDQVRAEQPDAATGRLSEQLTTRGVRTSVLDGAFLGGPFMVLWPAAFVAALIAQIRMVLELAALYQPDRDPAALTEDLLVLQGVSPTTEAARALLDAAAAPRDRESGAEQEPEAPPSWWVMVRRLAYLIGLLTISDRPVSLLRRAGVWLSVIAVVAVGFVVPLVWIPASAEMYRRATSRLAARTVAYYAPHGAGAEAEEGAADAGRGFLRPGALLVALRSAVSAVLIGGAVLTVVVADLRIASSHILAAVALLVGLSVLYFVVVRRRRRRH
ncbi:hypothetical protein ACFW1A_05125 [Kitasatospora sp. NPDC058965]|uniref:hypothetical protein n=1 Tax=Kitasatospora sp. NPDC058965 TaxID=3346682 RepID=UPI0036BC8AAC